MVDFERIGKYQIVGVIGEGAMGVVYKARDPILNRYVAIKVMSTSLKADPELRERFLREAQAAASLAHPNIITIYDYGEEQDRIYMAMELLVGTDLKELVDSPSLRRLEDKLGVMEQMCAGLAFAHEHGVVHRDIKPGNIHIQPNGQVKVLDFGLARLASSDMTKTGLVMGTPNYMSPEQVMGERVDARSDVFSLGAVFYELLSNHKPFDADSVHGVMFRVVHKEHPPIKEFAPKLPPIMVQVIDKALAKERTERFQNAGELREALAQVRKAIDKGRLQDATLVVEEVELVDDAAGAVGPPPATAGSGALATRPAPRPDKTKKPSATARGRASLQETGSLEPRPAPVRRPAGAPRPAPPARFPVALTAGIAVGVLALGAAGYWFWPRPAPPPPPSPAPADNQLGELREALVSTQIELARRDLQDKDYGAAVSQAERILRLAPGNPEAQKILDEATAARTEIEQTAQQARAALDAGRPEEAAEALSGLLALDPRHPAAAELGSSLNLHFRQRAEEARALMARSREEAQKIGASSVPAFVQADAAAREASVALRNEEFAVATRSFLTARDAFDKSRRSRQAELVAAATPAPTAAPTPEPTAPPITMAAATVPPMPAPTPLPTPPPPPRSFVPGRTLVLGQVRSSGPAGFDTGGVAVREEATDRAGTLQFRMDPGAPDPGQPWSVEVVLRNDGKKGADVKTIRAMTIVNGARTVLVPEVERAEIKPGQSQVVGRLSGTWPEAAPRSWSLDVVVVADKVEYKSQLVWK